MNGTTLYAHPDGGDIVYANGRISVADDEGTTEISLPIGPVGLKTLAHRLLALAYEVEASHED